MYINMYIQIRIKRKTTSSSTSTTMLGYMPLTKTRKEELRATRRLTGGDHLLALSPLTIQKLNQIILFYQILIYFSTFYRRKMYVNVFAY